MKFSYYLGVIILISLSSCQSEAYKIGYNWAKHLCEIREHEVNGGEKADRLTALEIVTIKGITEVENSNFEGYVSGFEKYANEECEHRDYLLNALERTKNKREKIIDGTYWD